VAETDEAEAEAEDEPPAALGAGCLPKTWLLSVGVIGVGGLVPRDMDGVRDTGCDAEEPPAAPVDDDDALELAVCV